MRIAGQPQHLFRPSPSRTCHNQLLTLGDLCRVRADVDAVCPVSPTRQARAQNSADVWNFGQWRMAHALLAPSSIVPKAGTCWHFPHQQDFFIASQPAQSSRPRSLTIGDSREFCRDREKSRDQCRQPPAGRPRHPTDIREAGRRPPTKFEAGFREKHRPGRNYTTVNIPPTSNPSHRIAAPLSNHHTARVGSIAGVTSCLCQSGSQWWTAPHDRHRHTHTHTHTHP